MTEERRIIVKKKELNDITEEDMLKVLNIMKSGKSVGLDGIPIEFLKKKKKKKERSNLWRKST